MKQFQKIFLFSLLCISSISAKTKKIYLDCFSEEDRNDAIFSDRPQENAWKIIRDAAQKNGYTVTTKRCAKNSNDTYIVTHFDMPHNLNAYLQTFEAEKLAVMLWEPPTVRPENFDKNLHKKLHTIFTWDDRLIDNKKYFKFFYLQPHFFIREPLHFKDKKFCCSMVANKRSNHPNELYTERLNAINFFENTDSKNFDLFGPGWQSLKLNCYKGFVQDKFSTLQHYKFCICYENIKDIPGYISEKIHHCLFVGCVPIYLGASNIDEYIPYPCFIDKRKFASYQELYDYLVSMTEKEYQSYVEAGRKYLDSIEFGLFSHLYFAESLLKGFIKDYDRNNYFDDEDVTLLKQISTRQEKIILKSKML